jgi:hypothetical protein
METIYSVLEIIDKLLRPPLLLVATAFAISFALKKVGTRVKVSYKVGFEGFSHPRILNLVFNNCKDSPVSIYSVQAVFDGELWLEVDKFDPPIILKPLETISVRTSEFSKLYVGRDEFKPDLRGNISIYIETDGSLLKCIPAKKKNLLDGLTVVSKETAKFDGKVFNSSVKFIMQYVHKGVPNVAFIHESGHIGHEWSFGSLNNIGGDPSEETIKEFLVRTGLGAVINSYVCYRVSFPFTEVAFRKSGNV